MGIGSLLNYNREGGRVILFSESKPWVPHFSNSLGEMGHLFFRGGHSLHAVRDVSPPVCGILS
jgi:hypothetical protein